METRAEFYNLFKRKMLYLALITVILISLSMPITYFIMGLENVKIEAEDHSRELGFKLKEQVRENPDFWQFNVHKFLSIFENTQIEDINVVNIYNNKWELIRQEEINESDFWVISGLTPLKYNNEIYGYVEVEHQSDALIRTTSILFAIFLTIGLAFGRIIYKYPAKIVKRAEQEVNKSIDKLKELSYIDTLTNLPNRRYFEFLLNKEIELARETNEKVAVMFIDLDDFKLVNDSFGHKAGDLLLKLAGDRLRRSVRKNDFIARLGGDEFIVTLPTVRDEGEVVNVAERIIQGLKEPYLVEGYQVTIQASIGISLYPGDGNNVETLVANADAAMFKAKELGKSEYEFYNWVVKTSFS